MQLKLGTCVYYLPFVSSDWIFFLAFNLSCSAERPQLLNPYLKHTNHTKVIIHELLVKYLHNKKVFDICKSAMLLPWFVATPGWQMVFSSIM